MHSLSHFVPILLGLSALLQAAPVLVKRNNPPRGVIAAFSHGDDLLHLKDPNERDYPFKMTLQKIPGRGTGYKEMYRPLYGGMVESIARQGFSPRISVEHNQGTFAGYKDWHVVVDTHPYARNRETSKMRVIRIVAMKNPRANNPRPAAEMATIPMEVYYTKDFPAKNSRKRIAAPVSWDPPTTRVDVQEVETNARTTDSGKHQRTCKRSGNCAVKASGPKPKTVKAPAKITGPESNDGPDSKPAAHSPAHVSKGGAPPPMVHVG